MGAGIIMAANGKPVTKAELDAALTATKDDLHAALTATKDDLHAALTATKDDLHAAVAVSKNELRDELIEFMRGIETNLLTEFHKYAKGQQARLHSLEIGEADVKLRLATIEER